ncbi:MAG: hypothetical protein N3G22_01825 [Candidatus Micrarchaeota archaeon]|nr:hypothetical protein [Candidatus Micrarchaeota archaeon]
MGQPSNSSISLYQSPAKARKISEMLPLVDRQQPNERFIKTPLLTSNPLRLPYISKKKKKIGSLEAEQINYSGSRKNRLGVFLGEYASSLSYVFGAKSAFHGAVFSDEDEQNVFVTFPTEGERHASSLLEASAALSAHSSKVVGYVLGLDRKYYVVLEIEGRAALPQLEKRRLDFASLSGSERTLIQEAIFTRLLELHKDGLFSGGVLPYDIQFSGGEVKILNPAKITPLESEDHSSLFYEAAVTLGGMLSHGIVPDYKLAKRAAKKFLSRSPLIRASATYFKNSIKDTKNGRAALLGDKSLSSLLANAAYNWAPHLKKEKTL